VLSSEDAQANQLLAKLHPDITIQANHLRQEPN